MFEYLKNLSLLFHAVVEKGEIKWDDDDNWEVEQILDHVEEEVRSQQADTCWKKNLNTEISQLKY